MGAGGFNSFSPAPGNVHGSNKEESKGVGFAMCSAFLSVENTLAPCNVDEAPFQPVHPHSSPTPTRDSPGAGGDMSWSLHHCPSFTFVVLRAPPWEYPLRRGAYDALSAVPFDSTVRLSPSATNGGIAMMCFLLVHPCGRYGIHSRLTSPGLHVAIHHFVSSGLVVEEQGGAVKAMRLPRSFLFVAIEPIKEVKHRPLLLSSHRLDVNTYRWGTKGRW